jgi:hypothetical protein
MSDKPILFSGPMVRALLEGRKTQTRRVLKPPVSHDVPLYGWKGETAAIWKEDGGLRNRPYRPGDRLWVRETLKPWSKDKDVFAYAADDMRLGQLTDSMDWPVSVAKRPYVSAIHLPRWASRLTLLVDDVRVQRLQNISEADAIAEGVSEDRVILDIVCYGGPTVEKTGLRYFVDTPDIEDQNFDNAVEAYAHLWDHINGPGAWEANPWVAAITFRVIRENIDQVLT